MTETEIRSYLTTSIIGSTIYTFDEIDSTNRFLRSLVQHDEPTEGTLVIAEHQTAGRGRLNRSWIATSGKNLTFSLLLKPRIESEQLSVVSLFAATAIAEAIEDATQIPCECKWPNDVLIRGRKFCGILSEAVFHDMSLRGIVVGIGINVNETSFSPELSDRATSLQLACGKELNRAFVLGKVLASIEQFYALLHYDASKEILQRWSKRCHMFGKPVTVFQNGTSFAGIARRLDDRGALVVDRDGVAVTVYAGDVSLRSQH